MGDTGSMLLGLLLAYVPIWAINSLDFTSLNNKANRYAEILPLLLPAAVLVIPYVDMLRAVIRRTRAGMSPFAADRKHLHHTMLEVGHSHRSSVLILYAWAALFAGTVVGLSIVTVHLAVLIWITLAATGTSCCPIPKLRWWERNRLDQAPVTGPADRPVGASESRAAIPLEVGVARGPAMPHGGGARTEADARAEGGHPAGAGNGWHAASWPAMGNSYDEQADQGAGQPADRASPAPSRPRQGIRQHYPVNPLRGTPRQPRHIGCIRHVR
jgi:UDP-GlcNAc:undecaprenyl-phosphate GlcNAc-1-phosphate transferase